MDFFQYISTEALIIVPVLWVIGTVLKNSKYIPDNLIPVILIVLGVVLTNLLLGISAKSVIQGVLVGGSSVGLNQVVKQIPKE